MKQIVCLVIIWKLSNCIVTQFHIIVMDSTGGTGSSFFLQTRASYKNQLILPPQVTVTLTMLQISMQVAEC